MSASDSNATPAQFSERTLKEAEKYIEEEEGALRKLPGRLGLGLFLRVLALQAVRRT